MNFGPFTNNLDHKIWVFNFDIEYGIEETWSFATRQRSLADAWNSLLDREIEEGYEKISPDNGQTLREDAHQHLLESLSSIVVYNEWFGLAPDSPRFITVRTQWGEGNPLELQPVAREYDRILEQLNYNN